MKNKIILGIFIIIATVINVTAAPISQSKIKRLIKKAAEYSYLDYQLLAGMDYGIQRGGDVPCNNAKVNKIIIHKISKISTRHYRIFNSMEDNRNVFTNQSFDVTFILQGSCKLSYPAYVGGRDIRKNGVKYSKIIQGRVPFRNKLLKTTISRDTFYKNIWSSTQPEVVNKNESKRKREKYRMRLYKKIGKNLLCRDFHYSGLEQMDMRMDAPMCQVVSSRNLKNDSHTQADLQRFNRVQKELNQYLNSYPNADKIISSQSKAVVTKGFQKIMWAKTPQERHRLFIQTMNKWQRGY